MNARSWVIGSSPECDIRLESPTVSATHCRLIARGESFLLEDLQSSNGTFVAGDRIDGPRIVRRGDPVTLGRSVPLPWPPATTSIAIGRLPDNDLVIPLETVSGHHARLEREGSQVYLVDLGSTNGTAINDPLNKITRGPVKATDFVFLGTHRVNAADLLAALPAEPLRQATLLERQRPAELEPSRASLDREALIGPASARPRSWPPAMYSRRSWAWGIAMSALCVAVVFGGTRLLRPPITSTDESVPAASQPNDHPTLAVTPSLPTAVLPPVTDNPASEKTDSIPKQLPPDENIVRNAEGAVVLIGLRFGGKLVLGAHRTSDHTWHALATGWACRPDAVICPTSILERLEGIRGKNPGGDHGLVVSTPTQTIAILSHKVGHQEAEGFSLAMLEAPLDAVTSSANTPASPSVLGQKLAMLSARSQDDDPKTIVRPLAHLTVERVERSPDAFPAMLHCTCPDEVDNVIGSPVFDPDGHVLGCAKLAVHEAHGIQVVPIARLASLLKISP